MVPLETAYRNGIRIDEFPMQELHGVHELVNVEGEGNNRVPSMQFSGGAALANVGNDGEICGNLHASSIAHARDATRPYERVTPVSIDAIAANTCTETTWSARRSHGTGSFGNRAYQNRIALKAHLQWRNPQSDDAAAKSGIAE